MNDVPHDDDSSDDIDDLYRRAAAQDPSRPSERTRQAVLQHAAQAASNRLLEHPSPPVKAKRFVPPRRAALWGTLAAAVLAGLVVAPTWLLTPSKPTPVEPPTNIARIEAPVASRAASAPRAQSVPAAKIPPAAAPPASFAPRAPSLPRLAGVPAASPGPATPSASAVAPTNPEPSRSTAKSANAQSSAHDATAGFVATDKLYTLPAAPDSPLVGAAVRRTAEQGDIARLQFLLDRGANINARDADDRTPLMLAVLHGRAKVADLLLAHGADVNTPDRTGTTPLQAAESTHQSAIAAALRAAGAK